MRVAEVLNRHVSRSGRPLRVILIACSLTVLAAAQFGVGIAVGEPGAPLAITSATTNGSFYYSTVMITNRSRKRVVDVDFGVDVFSGANLDHPALAGPFLRRADVPAGGASTVSLDIMPTPDPGLPAGIGRLKEIRLGVLAVHYADGSTWSYDHAGRGSFTPGEPALAKAKILPCGEMAPAKFVYRGRVTLRSAEGSVPLINYRCQGTTIEEYCDNQNTKCTDEGCPAGPCADQECQAIPPSHPASSAEPSRGAKPLPARSRPPVER